MKGATPPPMGLQSINNGYSLKTSNTKISSTTYTNDLDIITNKLTSLQIQLNKLDKYWEWACMDLGIPKYVVIECSNKAQLRPQLSKHK